MKTTLLAYLVAFASVAFGAEPPKSVDETTETLRRLQEGADFKSLPEEIKPVFLLAMLRHLRGEKIVRAFFECKPSARGQWGHKAACDVIGQKSFAILKDYGLKNRPVQPREYTKKYEAEIAIIGATTFDNAIVVRDTGSNEIEQYKIIVEDIEGRILVTSVRKDETFNAGAWLLEQQDRDVEKALRELFCKPAALRELNLPMLNKLLDDGTWTLRRARNLKGALAAEPQPEITYSVFLQGNGSEQAPYKYMSIWVAVRMLNEAWRIIAVAEDADERAVLEQKTSVAAFVTRYIKGSAAEREKMRAPGARWSLPDTGTVSMHRPIDPDTVEGPRNAKWEVWCVLTHSEDFGRLKKKFLHFRFLVEMNAEGEMRMCEDLF